MQSASPNLRAQLSARRRESAAAEVARIERDQAGVERDYLAEELGARAYERLSARLEQDHDGRGRGA